MYLSNMHHFIVCRVAYKVGSKGIKLINVHFAHLMISNNWVCREIEKSLKK